MNNNMSKNIVLCCDGTGDDFGLINTNVVQVAELAIKNRDQVVYYDPGVGTMNFLGRPRKRSVGALMGKLFGYGLIMDIMTLYRILMHCYESGDRVYIFGFSRGAYIARALAGMLYKCGLLQDGSYNLLPYVARMYITADNDALATKFKQTFSRPCSPYLIGVWDTVKSLGYFLGKEFFDTQLNPDTRYGYQAISIDEKRKAFDVMLWDERNLIATQTVEQVWFAGVHEDIGGGYPDRQLSDITLKWMLQKAERAGLKLNDRWQASLHPDARGVIHHSRKGLWKLWRPLNRVISEGSSIHQSVIDRLDDANLVYCPNNLPKDYRVVS